MGLFNLRVLEISGLCSRVESTEVGNVTPGTMLNIYTRYS